jgi:pimeloyl-ACP methyl ester carboxylesterase
LQVETLTPAYRVLAVDLPGHGRSPAPSRRTTISDMARAVAGALDDARIPQAHVVGLSLGAAVGLSLAVEHPRRVRSLVCVNGFARLTPSVRGLARGLVRLGLVAVGRMDWVGRWVAWGLFPGPSMQAVRRLAAERLAATSRQGYWGALWALARFDLRPRLAQIRVPVLVVAGDRDTTVPVAAKRYLATHIPEARLEVIHGSRHVTPVDAAPRFNAALIRFLAEVESRG